jgi:hypothetical protein
MAEYAVNLNNGTTDEKGAFRLMGKLLNQSGVIESTALTVSATTPTPDLTVKVSGSVASDNAVFITTTGDTHHGWNTTSPYSVTITANSTGVTKFDAIVAYIDTTAGSTTANNPGGLKFLAVRGSSTDGVTKATSADIAATAVGTKPYIRLADVTVGNGVSSINSGNIVDARPFAAIPSARLAANSATKATTYSWDIGSSPLTTASSTYVQVGSLSGTLVTLSVATATLLVTMNISGAYVNGGNARFGIDIDGQQFEVTATLTNTAQTHAGGATVVVLGLTAGTHTVKPIFLNTTGASTTSVAAYNNIHATITELIR